MNKERKHLASRRATWRAPRLVVRLGFWRVFLSSLYLQRPRSSIGLISQSQLDFKCGALALNQQRLLARVQLPSTCQDGGSDSFCVFRPLRHSPAVPQRPQDAGAAPSNPMPVGGNAAKSCTGFQKPYVKPELHPKLDVKWNSESCSFKWTSDRSLRALRGRQRSDVQRPLSGPGNRELSCCLFTFHEAAPTGKQCRGW